MTTGPRPRTPMVALRVGDSAHPAREPGRLGVLLVRDRLPVPTRSHAAPRPSRRTRRCRAPRRSARRRPAVTGLSTSNPNASEITFSWQDYYDTNAATSWTGETRQPDREAATGSRSTTDPSFSALVDTATVDQTTYTALRPAVPGRHATTGGSRPSTTRTIGLTWSAVADLHQGQPGGQSPSSPVGGAVVSGTTPFRWTAQPFAASYTVEVYKNNDLSFSAANRVFSATVRTTAVAPADPCRRPTAVPVAGPPDGRRPATSVPGRARAFFSTGVAPNLLAPKAGTGSRTRARSSSGPRSPAPRGTCSNIGGHRGEQGRPPWRRPSPPSALGDRQATRGA